MRPGSPGASVGGGTAFETVARQKAPGKHQAPSFNLRAVWCLRFGASLELGAWCLVLFQYPWSFVIVFTVISVLFVWAGGSPVYWSAWKFWSALYWSARRRGLSVWAVWQQEWRAVWRRVDSWLV